MAERLLRDRQLREVFAAVDYFSLYSVPLAR